VSVFFFKFNFFLTVFELFMIFGLLFAPFHRPIYHTQFTLTSITYLFDMIIDGAAAAAAAYFAWSLCTNRSDGYDETMDDARSVRLLAGSFDLLLLFRLEFLLFLAFLRSNGLEDLVYDVAESAEEYDENE